MTSAQTALSNFTTFKCFKNDVSRFAEYLDTAFGCDTKEASEAFDMTYQVDIYQSVIGEINRMTDKHDSIPYEMYITKMGGMATLTPHTGEPIKTKKTYWNHND